MLTLAKAQHIADHLLEALRPGAERIEIAGSIRRQKAEGIRDIDVVVVPRAIESGQLSLLASEADYYCGIWRELEALRQQKRLVPMRPIGEYYGDDDIERLWMPRQWHRTGERSTTITAWLVKPAVRVEIHRVAPAQWGCALMVRTGCSEFSRWMVGTALPKRNLHEAHYRVVQEDGSMLETPEEADVFAVAGLEYIEPTARWRVPQ